MTKGRCSLCYAAMIMPYEFDFGYELVNHFRTQHTKEDLAWELDDLLKTISEKNQKS